ncbi:bZIP transcription factor 17-like [Cucumis melo var. makuwa]|uniref:BZIP transcription factor 17-like n=2 Tax=Cucumis melo TaxID=3656 RepID=A0A5D3DPE2_CUCMM|nr:bZIP transcription factor 17-like [Cucumis melo var. makuwa]TYK25494.1 bZIP transcription factor 17-like [Cucumis melo var. makuwa]
MPDPFHLVSPSDQNPNSTSYASEFDSLPIPPLDSLFFSDPNHDGPGDPFLYSTALDLGFDENDDFELTFDDLDDLCLPSEADDFLISDNLDHPTNSPHLSPDVPLKDDSSVPLCSPAGSPGSGSSAVSCQQSPDDRKFLNYESSKLGTADSECFSTGSGGCDSKGSRMVNSRSPELGDHEFSGGPASSQGSGSGVSEGMNCPSSNAECYDVIVDQKVKSEEVGKNCMTKRKKEQDEGNGDFRSAKYQRSSVSAEATNPQLGSCSINEDDEKRKARLMRNRESAQLSRQRKKHYVEELEDKVRNMHSTIAELNSKISYMMAENAGLRQQLSGSGMCQPPPPGMFPHPSMPPMPPMPYSWMPCAPYVVKPQGSQVPLVPIPRLKPQQPIPVARGKKTESKKTEGRTKKAASVSFLGLLFFIMVFGGLVPLANDRFGNVGVVPGKLSFIGDNRLYNRNQGRVLRVDEHSNLSDGVNVGTHCGKSGTLNRLQCERIYRKGRDLNFDQRGKESQHLNDSDESVKLRNASEPLVASLYVPRNDKLVKIDGNLIIHSFLASEKAMASRRASDTDKARETGLAIPRDLSPALTIPNIRALPSRPANRDHKKATAVDGKLQQWFREGLAGPMLSSGLCTEVFQFDVSSTAPGAIVPASSLVNTSRIHRKNGTHLNKGKNRRILGGLPVPLSRSNFNITEEPARNPHKDNFPGNNNKTASSMVVSVLIDPREAGDSEVDGVITPKSLSRIFVVVLLDSVKYVTYSCVLPRSGPHLVST